MNERYTLAENQPKILILPINERARKGEFPDSQIFGITDDLPIILDLFGKEGLVVPDNDFVGQLRGCFVKLLAKCVTDVPLYLH